jgi:hypothetical protein
MRDDEGKARRFAKHLRQSMTHAEVILWSRLRRWPSGAIKFRRQHPIGIYIADFAVVSARLAIEVDGATHSSDEERVYDAARDTYAFKMTTPTNGSTTYWNSWRANSPLRLARARHLPRKRGRKVRGDFSPP